MRFLPKIFFLTMMLFGNISASSQTYESEIYLTVDGSECYLSGSQSIEDSSENAERLREFIRAKKVAGYVAVSRDSTTLRNDTFKNYIYLGKQYRLEELIIPDLSKKDRRKAKLQSRKYLSKPYSDSLLSEINYKLLQFYAAQGYPFCQTMVEIKFSGKSGISLHISVSKNKSVRIGDVFLKGSIGNSQNYIRQYLSLQSGMLYNEAAINQLSSKISESEFLSVIRPPEVEFIDSLADIYLYLNRQSMNRVNGIVGFAPDSLNDNKLYVTGELNLHLGNAFGRGEIISLNWNRLKPASQRFDMAFRYPYPWGLPLEPSFGFLLDKTDSSFLNLETKVELDYIFPNSDRLIMGVSAFRSSVLNAESQSSLGDASRLIYSLGYALNTLNYRANPSGGYAFTGRFGAGSRKTGGEQSKIFNIDFQFEFYRRLYRSLVLKTGLRHRSLYSTELLYENELYRFGGYQSMRGFHEQEFFTENHSTLTAELRLLYEKDASVYLFYDYGIFKNRPEEWLSLHGFGPGLSIKTKAGLFSLNYALGKKSGIPLQLADSKIHVAYSNRF